MTPDELVTVCRELIEALDLITLDGPKGPQPEQRRLMVALDDLARSAREASKRTNRDVAADTPWGQAVEIDGRWFQRDDAKSTTGWDRDALNRRVTAAALEPHVDRETGEVSPPSAEEAVSRMWRFVAVAEGRSKVLGQIGITADEYATVQKVKRLREVVQS